MLRDQLQSSEETKYRALEQIKNLDTQKLRLIEETESLSKAKQIELETDLEEKTREYEFTIRETQQKSEEQLAQLKSFYEVEKERVERRL